MPSNAKTNYGRMMNIACALSQAVRAPTARPTGYRQILIGSKPVQGQRVTQSVTFFVVSA